MVAARAAALLLAALVAADVAHAQDDDATAPRKPIPYTQLVRHDRREERPRPRPAPHAVARKPAQAPRPAAGPPPVVGLRAPPPLAPAPPPAPAASQPPTTVAPVAAPRPAPAAAIAHPPPPAAAPTPIAPLPAPTAGSRPAPAAVELEAFVDGEVARGLRDGHGVGAAVAVVANGQVLLEKGYGFADLARGRRADPRRTVFRLGSASRLLTAIEVLRQVDAGRLRLDAPVGAALPPALKLPAEGFARPVLLEQALRHTSGLEARDLGRLYVDAARVAPLDAALVRDRPHRVREPGALAVGGDYATALAGAAAAHAAGAEFEMLMERDLLAPAGLASTSFREPRPPREGLPLPMSDARAARLALGYGWSTAGSTPTPYGLAGGLAPALSATTTADDMARLMLVELAGGRRADGVAVWSAATAARLDAEPPPSDDVGGATPGRMRTRLPGGTAGFGEAGAAPGFRVRYLVAPRLGLGVFIAVTGEGAGALAEGLAPDLVARFYPAPASAAAEAAETGRPDGLYLDARRAYHGLEAFVDRTRRLVRVRSAPDGALVTRGEGLARRWTPVGEGVFHGDDGAELRLLGAAARPAALVEPGRAFAAERVGWLNRPETLEAAAALAAVAALLTLLGPFGRMGRENQRATGPQTAASVSQGLTAALWLGAIGAYAVFAREGAATVDRAGPWPDGWLVGASCAALAAAVLTAAQVLQLPGAWAEGRRLAGWAAGRKLRHTLTVLVFAGFAAVLAAWGALEPWSS